MKHANYIKLDEGGRNGGQPAVVKENFSSENGNLLPSNNKSKLKRFEVCIINDNLQDLDTGGTIQIDILAFTGKMLASRTFSNLPMIPALNNTIFEIMFADNLNIDRLKHYVRARFTPPTNHPD